MQPARKVTVKLPGRCVDTQRHAAGLVAGSSRANEIAEHLEAVMVAYTWDLDGDGIEDELRSGGAAGFTGTWHLYVRRGSCGHYVGTITADVWPKLLGRHFNGLEEIGGYSSCEKPPCSWQMWRKWRFDGAGYQLAEEMKASDKRERPGP